MRTRLGLLSVLWSIGLATPAAAYCRLTTESPSTAERGGPSGCTTAGEYLLWQQRCISYTLVPNEQLGLDLEAVRDTIEASFATWMAVQCDSSLRLLPIVAGQTDELGECSIAEYNRFGPNANTVVFASDWESRGRDFVPEAYGLTLVWHDPQTGQILDADIQINLNRGDIVICGGETCENQVDLQNVLTHEAGHFLGLAHSENKHAAMYGDAPLGQTTKRLLTLDDVEGICAAYGMLPTPVCERHDYAPRRGFTPECARPMESSGCTIMAGPARRVELGSCLLVLLAPWDYSVEPAAPRRLVPHTQSRMHACIGLLTALFVLVTEMRMHLRPHHGGALAGGACSTAGRGLAWQRQCISYTIVPRGYDDLDLEEIRATIDDSFAVWTQVECGNDPLPVELGQTEPLGQCSLAQYNQFGPNANMIMFLSEWEGKDFPDEAFGLTLVWHDPQTGDIFDADMQLNETIAPIAICGADCDSDSVDLANVVTHEAGHFLGLGHSNVGGATMSANALLGETAKRSLEQDDRNGVCSIYANNPRPSCDDEDFAPDRGFTARCGAVESESNSCAAGAVGSKPSTQAPLPLALLVLAFVWGWRKRRRREGR